MFRNPADAAVSFYHFKKDWMFDEGDMSLDEFVEYFFLSLGEPKARLEFASHHHSIGDLPTLGDIERYACLFDSQLVPSSKGR